MADGSTFYRRLAGNWLKKATGLKHEDGRIPEDYAYIEMRGIVATEIEDVGTIIQPVIPVDVKLRCFVEVNPKLFVYGSCNSPNIVEKGDTIGVVVRTDAADLKELLENNWIFRVYVAR